MSQKRITAEDFIGRRFGSWTVINADIIGRGRKRRALCECDCGTVADVDLHSLTSGDSTRCATCGRRAVGEANATHGLSWTTAHRAWTNMRRRCGHDPNYTERGIAICDRWGSFEHFLEDMGVPAPGMSLDRIDNDGNYEPVNCRWATRREQVNNRSNTVFVEAFGERLSLRDWSASSGVDHKVLGSRIRLGWLPEDALTRPVKTRADALERER